MRRNEEINAPQLRVIAADGSQAGVMSRYDALQMASAAELDLVEVSPTAEPPVVRIMDYGKFLFEQNKKAHSAKRKQKQIQVKEVKFRPGTGESDYQIKLRNLTRFLTEGDKAKEPYGSAAARWCTRISGANSSIGSRPIWPRMRWSSRTRSWRASRWSWFLRRRRSNAYWFR